MSSYQPPKYCSRCAKIVKETIEKYHKEHTCSFDKSDMESLLKELSL